MAYRGMGGARWIQKREPFPQGGQKKAPLQRLTFFCVRGIKNYPSEDMKELDGGQLFR